MELRGKAALVTGSATGIGRATALALARRGCHVVVNYTRSESEARTTVSDVEALGARALLHRCDVVDDEAVRAMVAACERELGRLDVLVNAAGTTHFAPFDDLERSPRRSGIGSSTSTCAGRSSPPAPPRRCSSDRVLARS